MSTTHTQVLLPTAAPAVRWLVSQAATLRRGLSRAGSAIWRGLEEVGHRRADRELTMMADRWQAENPTLARQLRSYVRGSSSY